MSVTIAVAVALNWRQMNLQERHVSPARPFSVAALDEDLEGAEPEAEETLRRGGEEGGGRGKAPDEAWRDPGHDRAPLLD